MARNPSSEQICPAICSLGPSSAKIFAGKQAFVPKGDQICRLMGLCAKAGRQRRYAPPIAEKLRHPYLGLPCPCTKKAPASRERCRGLSYWELERNGAPCAAARLQAAAAAGLATRLAALGHKQALSCWPQSSAPWERSASRCPGAQTGRCPCPQEWWRSGRCPTCRP